MPDNPENTLIPARILASDLDAPELFEQERLRIHTETINNPDARTELLSELVGKTMLKGGEISLIDEVMEQATAEQEDTASKAREKLEMVKDAVMSTKDGNKVKTNKTAQRPRAKGYEFRMDGEGNITMAGPVSMHPTVDEAPARRNQARIPSGPKQNDSSFRTSGLGARH